MRPVSCQYLIAKIAPATFPVSTAACLARAGLNNPFRCEADGSVSRKHDEGPLIPFQYRPDLTISFRRQQKITQNRKMALRQCMRRTGVRTL